MKRGIPIAAALATYLCAQPVAVRQPEGQVRAFLIVRNTEGDIIANGDSIQTVRNGKVIYKAAFHFKDGSLQDDTTVFTQNGHFRVLSDRLIEKGPMFKYPIDLTLNATTGMVTVVYTDDKGVQKTEKEHMDLPPDLANGIVPFLLKNLAPGTQSVSGSMVVASPKPMLIKVQIHSEGEDPFTTGSFRRKAIRYNVHVDIGGVKGVVANVLGKEPPDTRVWLLGGDCPTFVRAQGPWFEGGPIWSTELVSPVFSNDQPVSTRVKK